MTVMVAVPYRETTKPIFLDLTRRHYNALTYADKRLVVSPNAIAKTARQYEANAIARNQLIAENLRDEDEFILWMDVDLVKVPANLIEVLFREAPASIIAPLVYVEKLVPVSSPSLKHGGWFYDTGAFVKDGIHAQTNNPIFPGYAGGTVEVDSVGCCYLIPAQVYRLGGYYECQNGEVEHLSLMAQAREMGYKVYMTNKVIVEHAYLPKYGERWHL